jgi:predicted O-methyltransferase YrrM
MFNIASLKTSYIKMLCRVALLPPFRLAVYSRQPFVRYPYMYEPSHLIALNDLLLSIQVPGAAIEVGCNQGWTTCWLLEALREAGINRPYHCLDTFTGFLAEDVAVEVNDRGKTAGAFAENFAVNDQRWLDESLRRFGYTNVTTHKADASTFNYTTIGPIAFALIDVDIYRPVKLSLQLVLPCMVKGGLVVVDDCDPKHALWDGAYQAYTEICRENGLSVEILGGKLGVIRI